MLTHSEQSYEYEETRELVALVNDAAESVRSKGEAAFSDFRVSGSRWRREETYVFVLDPEGNMLVHPDPELEGRNVLALKDINGKPIIRGLIDAATAVPDKPEGWHHYQWPVPGGLLPRWKSTLRGWQQPRPANVILSAAACTTIAWKSLLSWMRCKMQPDKSSGMARRLLSSSMIRPVLSSPRTSIYLCSIARVGWVGALA